MMEYEEQNTEGQISKLESVDLNYYNLKSYKDEQVNKLQAIDIKSYNLDEIDSRLVKYVSGVASNPDAHNLYEILGVIKFFHLLDTYVFKPKKVKKFIKLYESLKFSGLDGRKKYKVTPVQYYQFASMLGFYNWVKVGEQRPGEPDSESKKVKVENGCRYELRRLITEAILFVPRKFSKTTSTASLAVNELLFGDSNAQAYCAANSYKQAKICFEEVSKIIRQLDKSKKYFKVTRETVKWKPNDLDKESFAECLSGGAETKDGLNASLIIFDEYAQARYVRDHSVGSELLQVLMSSMGARREPLTVIMTTASRFIESPFTADLESAKSVLRGECKDDHQFCLIFQPDAWENSDEFYGKPELWRKCNPHIGITVQENWYHDCWDKALRSAERKTEFITKNLNVFIGDTTKTWMPLNFCRSLQLNFDIEKAIGRPEAMCAFDLSTVDDFSVVCYNMYIRSERKFYIWLDTYIPEQTLTDHANKELYKYWVEQGWMKVCPGYIISNSMIVEDILKKNRYLKILQIGYDSWKAQECVNALSAAIAATAKPENILKPVSQTYGAFTSPVESFELAAWATPSRVVFGPSPILPYCFSNCFLDVDKMGNKKPQKKNSNQKIDGAIAALMTFSLFNNYEH